MVYLIRKIAFLSSLLIGTLLVFLASIPIFYAYPYSDGSNSGPLNTWELVRMIAYDSWALFLSIGVVLSIASVLGLKGKILSH